MLHKKDITHSANTMYRDATTMNDSSNSASRNFNAFVLVNEEVSIYCCGLCQRVGDFFYEEL